MFTTIEAELIGPRDLNLGQTRVARWIICPFYSWTSRHRCLSAENKLPVALLITLGFVSKPTVS